MNNPVKGIARTHQGNGTELPSRFCVRYGIRISKANDAVQAEIGGAEPGSYYSCLA